MTAALHTSITVVRLVVTLTQHHAFLACNARCDKDRLGTLIKSRCVINRAARNAFVKTDALAINRGCSENVAIHLKGNGAETRYSGDLNIDAPRSRKARSKALGSMDIFEL